jgi:hypothetical protein
MVLKEAASQLGIPIWLLLISLVWIVFWKILSMWKAARNNHKIWFVVLLLVNTIGLLEVLYYFVFSEIKSNNKDKIKKKRK